MWLVRILWAGLDKGVAQMATVDRGGTKAWPDRYTEGFHPPSPQPATMLRTAPLYPLYRELERHLPSVRGHRRRGLALWLRGMLLTGNGGQNSVAAALEAHGGFETVRRELQEWTCDDVDRICSWGPGQKVDVTACFPDPAVSRSRPAADACGSATVSGAGSG